MTGKKAQNAKWKNIKVSVLNKERMGLRGKKLATSATFLLNELTGYNELLVNSTTKYTRFINPLSEELTLMSEKVKHNPRNENIHNPIKIPKVIPTISVSFKLQENKTNEVMFKHITRTNEIINRQIIIPVK